MKGKKLSVKDYERIDPPTLLEGVGKMHIYKDNNNVQLILQHAPKLNKKLYFFKGQQGEDWDYANYEDVLKEWHLAD